MFSSMLGFCQEEIDTDDFFKEQDMIVPAEGCSIGDHVVCKLRERILVTRFEKHDDYFTFAIVGKHIIEDGVWDYVGYVPEYEAAGLRGTFSIRPSFAEAYGIKKKFIGELGIILRKNNVTRVSHRADGLSCSRCDEFFGMAAGNQEDGTLICYLCRERPYR